MLTAIAIAWGTACLAVATIALEYARRCRVERNRQAALTDQFCFDSFAFSKLWQDEVEANRPLVRKSPLRDPLTGRFTTGENVDEQVPF